MNLTHCLLSLVLAVGLATIARSHAGEPVDFDAEAKQAAQEEAEQKAERDKGVTGKYQRTFFGTFQRLSDSDGNAQQISPDVLGIFVTNAQDRKPDRTYLVKAESGNKGIIETLKKFDGKKSEVTGKLRVISPEGEAKYLIISMVVEVAATPPVKQRRNFGGL